MTTPTFALADSATMLRRNLRHALRYPAMTGSAVMVPVLILLLFVGVLGDTLKAGLGPAAGGAGYIGYVTPGIVLMTVASGCMATSVAVCVDVTGGIIDRFRTLSISRTAVLAGHVIGSVIQTMVSLVLVFAVALLLGFRPRGGPLAVLAAAGLMLATAFALTWLAVLIGLVSRNPESASNTPMLIQFLPFLSSAFVPASAMPAGVRWFAEHQPFTPVIETTRGLLLGTPVGDRAVVSLAWCLGIALAGYLGARAVFNRPRAS
jgi:ABC-2 type transport system permease protein